MKITIFNQEKQAVFTFDVETGKATISAEVTMDEVATEFVRAIETAVYVASQFKPDASVRDVLIEAGKGEGSGNLNIRMGDGPGSNGAMVEGLGIEEEDYTIKETVADPPNPHGVSIKNAVRRETPT